MRLKFKDFDILHEWSYCLFTMQVTVPTYFLHNYKLINDVFIFYWIFNVSHLRISKSSCWNQNKIRNINQQIILLWRKGFLYCVVSWQQCTSPRNSRRYRTFYYFIAGNSFRMHSGRHCSCKEERGDQIFKYYTIFELMS